MQKFIKSNKLESYCSPYYFFVSFIVTKEIFIATTIGLTDSLIKIFAYYSHERIWEKVNIWRIKD